MGDVRAVDVLGLSGSDWGYLVIDAETGETLAERRADEAFPPASTAKLPTMIAALSILGPEYRFATRVLAHGKFKDGVIKGDIALAGDGDPLLAAGDVRALAVRLRDLGIRRVDGRFFYHGVLPTFAEVEPNQPETAPYNQGVGGLNIEFNRATVTRDERGNSYVTPAEAEDLVPPLDAAGPLRTDLPVRAPDLLLARLLHRFSATEGIELPQPEPGTPPDGAMVIAEVKSQPLIEIARAGLEYSNNMIAETIGMAAARQLGTPYRSLAESALGLGLWLEREVPNLARFAPNMLNHSGLSARSRITPRQMTSLLRYALKRRYGGWRFDTLLPPGGGREGYRGRFKEPGTAYRIWAKSGTMRYIKGLAGYFDSASGRRAVFALFVHDADRRSALEAGTAQADEKARRMSDGWRERTDKFEAALVKNWVSSH